MYEQLLKQTERFLESKADPGVPVKQLWDAMVKEGAKKGFAVPSLMADYECLLEGDARFEFVAEHGRHSGNTPGIEELLEHDELEKLGFLTTQRVRLRRAASSLFGPEGKSEDALDLAVSLEDLGDNYPDSALLDSEPAPSPRRPGGGTDAVRSLAAAIKAAGAPKGKRPTSAKKKTPAKKRKK
ncbi:MAG TPA: hypothetical protein VMG34_00285 [Bacteroidota bacterium]|nr:hypothetical protein [Bacteroidota bacterium]